MASLINFPESIVCLSFSRTECMNLSSSCWNESFPSSCSALLVSFSSSSSLPVITAFLLFRLALPFGVFYVFPELLRYIIFNAFEVPDAGLQPYPVRQDRNKNFFYVLKLHVFSSF